MPTGAWGVQDARRLTNRIKRENALILFTLTSHENHLYFKKIFLIIDIIISYEKLNDQ
jgi:hypothetical protein